MTARWEKLPEKAKPAAKRGKVKRGTWRCCGAQGCGEVLDDVSWKAAERHADTHGGARLECVVSIEEDPDGEPE